jgi:hypothetical protein
MSPIDLKASKCAIAVAAVVLFTGAPLAACGGSVGKSSLSNATSPATVSGSVTGADDGPLGALRGCLHDKSSSLSVSVAEKLCARALDGADRARGRLTLEQALERAAVEKFAACMRENEKRAPIGLARTRCDARLLASLRGR